MLRRIGSTIYAGRSTAEKILREWRIRDLFDQEEEDDAEQEPGVIRRLFEDESNRALTPQEKKMLQTLIDSLDANQERDPKYREVFKYLIDQRWLELGSIVFSQYYDSIDRESCSKVLDNIERKRHLLKSW